MDSWSVSNLEKNIIKVFFFLANFRGVVGFEDTLNHKDPPLLWKIWKKFGLLV